MTTLTMDEREQLTAEIKRLNAINGVHAYAASKRLKMACESAARKYSTRPVGRITRAILAVWGLLWLGVAEWAEYLRAWNREGA